MEKSENIGFFSKFCGFDLKVSTYIQLIDLMKSYEYSRSRSSLDFGQRSFYILNLKPNFLRNHFTNQSQVVYVVSFGRGDQSLYKQSRSHDQDGCHAHIW